MKEKESRRKSMAQREKGVGEGGKEGEREADRRASCAVSVSGLPVFTVR